MFKLMCLPKDQSRRIWSPRNHFYWLIHLFAILCLLGCFETIGVQSFSAHAAGTTITLWHAYSGAEQIALNQVITNAEVTYPGITFNVVQKPFADIYTDYETAVLSGGGPDLYIAPNDQLGHEVRIGVLKDLTADLTGQLGHVDPSAISGMTVDGKIYAVPESNKAVALFYNKSKISSPASTTTALLNQVKTGKKLILIQHDYHLYGWWGAFGGQILGPNGFCNPNQPGLINTVQYLLDLQAAGASFQTDFNAAQTAFASGVQDMLIDGPWDLEWYRSALGSNLGVSLMPAGPVAAASPLTGFDGYYINPNTAHYSEVLALALYLTNQASSQIMMDTGGHIPIRDDITISDPLVLTFAQAANMGTPRPQTTYIDNYWGPFNDMLSRVLSGAQSSATGVSLACQQMNKANGFPFLFLPFVRR